MPDITVEPLLVDVFAPAVSTRFDSRNVLTNPLSFSVLLPPVEVVVGQPGSSIADLDLRPPNVVVRTLYELVVVGALGLPSVLLPMMTADIVKRRNETIRPIYGYSPSGKMPPPRETGVYLSSDSGTSWQDLQLPDFPMSTDFSQPVFADRGGTLFLFFGDRDGQIARYNTTTRQMMLSAFTGTAGDLALPRSASGIAVAPGTSQVVLYASGKSGIWKSTNNGDTFALSNTGQGARLAESEVAFHPVTAGLCYAGGLTAGPDGQAPTQGAPLYKSTDSGSTWTLVQTRPVGDGHILKIALGDDPDIVYLQTQKRVLKSTDQGASFSIIETGLPGDFTGLGALAVAPSDETQLWTVVGLPGSIPEPSKIYQSTDAGANWTLKQTISPVRGGPVVTGGITVHPTDPNKIAFATSGPIALAGVSLTTDGGTSWVTKDADDGITSATIIQTALWGVAYSPTTHIAVTGRHAPTNAGTPQKIKIGEEHIFGEIHEATMVIPFSTAFLDAVNARTDESGETPIFPLLQVHRIERYRSGARRGAGLCEVRMERMDVRQGSTDRQITLFGRQTHDNVARGPGAPRTVPEDLMEAIEDSSQEFSVTLPGVHTDWQTYQSVIVKGRTVQLSAIRYAITMERRQTILGATATSTAQIDPTTQSATDHPRAIIGKTPSKGRGQAPVRKRAVIGRSS